MADGPDCRVADPSLGRQFLACPLDPRVIQVHLPATISFLSNSRGYVSTAAEGWITYRISQHSILWHHGIDRWGKEIMKKKKGKGSI